MPDTLTRSRSDPSLLRTTFVLLTVLIIALASLVAFLAFSATLAGPGHVERVTVENLGPYAVNVTVSGSADGPAVGLGVVSGEATREFVDVLDQGEEWVFRFSYAGEDGGVVAVTRDELEAAGWEVAVPTSVSDRLRRAGLEPAA
jgi:hypothetical protein